MKKKLQSINESLFKELEKGEMKLIFGGTSTTTPTVTYNRKTKRNDQDGSDAVSD